MIVREGALVTVAHQVKEVAWLVTSFTVTSNSGNKHHLEFRSLYDGDNDDCDLYYDF